MAQQQDKAGKRGAPQQELRAAAAVGGGSAGAANGRGGVPKGVEAVVERWDFYRDESRSWKCVAQKLGVAVLVALLANPASYFAGVAFTKKGGVIGLDQQGHAVDIPQINDPVLSDAAIRRFCEESVDEEGTFGFNDFDNRFKVLQGRFTDIGWRKLNAAFEKGQIRASVIRWNQSYATQATAPCTILNHGVVNGRYWWKVKAEVMRRITSGGQNQDTKMEIKMELVRVGVAEARELVAIDRWEE